MLADLMRWNSGGKSKKTYDVVDTTVVAQPYSTEGNGGRKLVRLSNGWLVAVTKTTDQFNFFVDKKDGNSWRPLCHMTASNIDNNDIAIVSNGTIVYVLSGRSTSRVESHGFDAISVPNANIWGGTAPFFYTVINNETALGNVSLVINPQGTELHAAWSSKNTTYPNSFNIRYAKGTINGDGSVTWGAVEQVTTYNSTNYYAQEPTIVVGQNGYPTILSRARPLTSRDYIRSYYYNGSSFVTANVYDGERYDQSSPSAVTDKDGVIHVAWHGTDSTEATPRIRYSRSIDGGVTWSAMVLVSTNPNRLSPSISVDSLNKIFVSSNWSTTSVNTFELSGSTWTLVKTTTLATNPSLLYDPTFSLEFSNPPRIYMGTAGNVSFTGTWTE